MNAPKIMRSDDLRVENRHRILHALRQQGALSRAEIGKVTGLSPAALSTLFGLMTEQGIVTSENKHNEEQKRGRPKTTIAVNPNAAIAVTVALTINKLYFCVVNYAGVTLSQTDLCIDTRSLTKKQIFASISKGINEAIKPHSSTDLKAISIGFQGATSPSTGELLWSPILTARNVPIREWLKKKFGVPVSVNNDCWFIAKALHQQERKTLGDSFAAVLFLHGIGLGVYLGGKPFTGAYSSALELGHIQFQDEGALCRCGKQGCIEAYAADYGILRTASQVSPTEIPSGPVDNKIMLQLIEAATNDCPQALRAFELAGRAIGSGLATIFTLLDPIPIVLVGHSTDAVDLMRPAIEKSLRSAVGHSEKDYAQLLHCFDDDKPLLLEGLVLEALSIVDRVLAENNDETSFETTLV